MLSSNAVIVPFSSFIDAITPPILKEVIFASVDFLRVIVTLYTFVVCPSSAVTVYSTGFVAELVKSIATLDAGFTVAYSETTISGLIALSFSVLSSNAVIVPFSWFIDAITPPILKEVIFASLLFPFSTVTE